MFDETVSAFAVCVLSQCVWLFTVFTPASKAGVPAAGLSRVCLLQFLIVLYFYFLLVLFR